MSKRFTLPVEVDDFGDMSITLPAELMEDLGWYEGTELEWSEETDGSVVLKNPRYRKTVKTASNLIMSEKTFEESYVEHIKMISKGLENLATRIATVEGVLAKSLLLALR